MSQLPSGPLHDRSSLVQAVVERQALAQRKVSFQQRTVVIHESFI